MRRSKITPRIFLFELVSSYVQALARTDSLRANCVCLIRSHEPGSQPLIKAGNFFPGDLHVQLSV